MKVTPVLKKEDELSKRMIALVVAFPAYPRYFKEWSSTKLIFFFESRFLSLFTGFYINTKYAQNVILNLIEKWKHALRKGEKVGTIFKALSKAFDTLIHNLLLVKLNAYGFLSL